ncbi:MAG: thioredoxin [Alphaproteobacteria bacterium]|nr:thioredoxin [Alphaproteobacteria bacterium]
MSATVSDVTDSNFESEVLKSERPVLVDFWAEWCGPCKALAPAVHSVADEHEGALKVVKLDIQTNMKTAMSYRVSSIPTLIVFKNGAEVARQQGAAGGVQAIRRLVQAHV